MKALGTEPFSPTEAYRRIAAIRAFEERCLELSHDGTIAGSIHVCMGQEAIPVGVRATLRPQDRVLATYRGHGWALSCGIPIVEVLAEICHRDAGINGGRGGSAYLSAPEHGFLGENSIVGASVPIAAGVAMAAEAAGHGGIAVVSIGDGAMNQGSVHEALVFAASRDLPLLVVCENNGWSEMTPISRTIRGDDLARRADGLGIHTEIIDGCDPYAVRDAASRSITLIGEGRGPVLLECKTVRLSGHYNRDVEHYRPKADISHAQESEPLRRLRDRLLEDGLALSDQLDAIDLEVMAVMQDAVEQVLALGHPDPATAALHVTAPRAPSHLVRTPAGPATEMTYQRAINEALRTELSQRRNLRIYGEDVGHAGGIFGVSRSLQKEFGPDRVFDTPISESAILGSAVGSALEGLHPVVEIMWSDFLLVALDQLVNQAANVRYLSRSSRSLPMVVRVQQGVTPGSCAQHSQSLEALLAHVPGLNVGLVSSAADAHSMTRAAIASPDPTILIEARALYQERGPVHLEAPVEAVGGAKLRREGCDVAVVTWGTMVPKAIEAADQLAQRDISVSVIDLRWLAPLDVEALAQATRLSGGRVLVLHEANLTGGFGAEVAARIYEAHRADLTAPVRRLGTPDVRIPAAPVLQQAVVPQVADIVEACQALAGSAGGTSRREINMTQPSQR